MSPAFVLPISHAAARAWAAGWIGDAALLLDEHPDGAALYIMTLPDLASFRRLVPELLTAYRAGARALTLRTFSPAVSHHVEKWGAHRTFQDASGRWRYYAGPELMARYFGRLTKLGKSGKLSLWLTTH